MAFFTLLNALEHMPEYIKQKPDETQLQSGNVLIIKDKSKTQFGKKKRKLYLSNRVTINKR